MKFDQKQTELWIQDIKQGNEQAYREFYEYWYPRCFYIALAIMRNETDAKDAAQEAMLEVHKSIHNLRDIAYFKLWLNRIVSSKCNRIFRKRKDTTMNMLDDTRLSNIKEDRSYLLPDKANHVTTDCEVLQELLAHLSYKYREVLTLMYFEHMSIKEIAHCLQVPEGTVKSRLSSAKAKLKEEILVYEKQAGIPLNFKETTLEALLATSFMNYVSKHSQPSYIKQSIGKIKKPFVLGKTLLLTGTAIAVAGGIVLYHGNQKAPSESVHNPVIHNQTIQNVGFPELEFRNMKINNAKDAYFLLKKYAHCEYELSQLSEEEQEKIEEIRQTMLENSNVYADLYTKQ